MYGTVPPVRQPTRPGERARICKTLVIFVSVLSCRDR